MREVDGGQATISLGETAEEVAALDGIRRADSDAYALRSQQCAAVAIAAEHFTPEIVAVATPDGTVAVDETPRPDTTAERLAALRPSFRPDGVVTAGSASPLSDGASAIVVASAEAVRGHGLTPRARVVGFAASGVPPHLMGLGPVPATEKLLGRTGISLTTVDAVELNEAFAVQVLACQRRLGLDLDTLNTDGGAIALGHALGSSGCRLLVTLLGRLERADARRGIATLCVGVGQGVAMLVERG
jgi:acetyl-CoA acetyltransferase family protein